MATEHDTTPVEEIKADRSKALRAPKDIGEAADPDAHRVESPRTAVRYIEERDGVPYFTVVTTRLSGFPLGKDSYSEHPQDSVIGWARKHSDTVTVIDADDEEWTPDDYD